MNWTTFLSNWMLTRHPLLVNHLVASLRNTSLQISQTKWRSWSSYPLWQRPNSRLTFNGNWIICFQSLRMWGNFFLPLLKCYLPRSTFMMWSSPRNQPISSSSSSKRHPSPISTLSWRESASSPNWILLIVCPASMSPPSSCMDPTTISLARTRFVFIHWSARASCLHYPEATCATSPTLNCSPNKSGSSYIRNYYHHR